jgi:hypothetical protein
MTAGIVVLQEVALEDVALQEVAPEVVVLQEVAAEAASMVQAAEVVTVVVVRPLLSGSAALAANEGAPGRPESAWWTLGPRRTCGKATQSMS